ncbi:C4-dicarboxylate ABC transporter substrate-binding protein [Sphaerisporangium melleum]|uniref:C4-dicarboxylate ABC transporter substrate-binding protein n=1 Tax=Sphaerisporangium melleum TaxID=321316 RepID=A0A917RHT2_9ACTN|nr:tripartite tricarboxylate transporter substrate-binding protein [Sphaerisporangium melleum]GGL07598.1 C4-dicarboxylate ABC transporter substrate-binding protein [Sphaerisporangium melleum]GII68670.1 C4-dicarboxylate ABC transporter substrate-binding protein [Sphaerisporangium melleum]
MRRRQVLALGAGLVALAAGCGGPASTRKLAAATLPIVVPGPSGGDADRVARALKGVAEKAALVADLRPVNRPSHVALAEFTRVRHARQVLMAEPALVGTVRAPRQAGAFTGTTPLVRLCGEWEVLVVPGASRLRSFGAFADAMRRDPAGLAVAGRTQGCVDHMLLGMLAQSLGVDARLLRYVAYPTSGDAVTALTGGRAAAALAGHSGVRDRVRAGDLRVLAVSSPDRIPGVPAPTLLECDTHLDCANWRGILGPRDLPEDDLAALVEMCRYVAGSERWQQACARNGWAPLYLEGEDFRQWLRVETARLARAVGDLGLRT